MIPPNCPLCDIAGTTEMTVLAVVQYFEEASPPGQGYAKTWLREEIMPLSNIPRNDENALVSRFFCHIHRIQLEPYA